MRFSELVWFVVSQDGLNALDTAALLGNKETVELLEQVRREKSNPSDPEVLVITLLTSKGVLGVMSQLLQPHMRMQ